jgi:hypothetical protein
MQAPASPREPVRPRAGTLWREWRCPVSELRRRLSMYSIVYLVGLVVIVLAILSFFGLR